MGVRTYIVLLGISLFAPIASATYDKTQHSCYCKESSIWNFYNEGDDNNALEDDETNRRTDNVRPDKNHRNSQHDNQSVSISEGLVSGRLSPFFELTTKQSHPGDEALHLNGFSLGLAEARSRRLSLAYYRSGQTNFDAGTQYQIEYGGFILGRLPGRHKLTEWYFQMLVGTGQVKVKLGEIGQTSRLLTIFEPEIGAGLNVTPWMQIRLGVSYRYLSGLQVLGLSSNELRGATGNLHMLFRF